MRIEYACSVVLFALAACGDEAAVTTAGTTGPGAGGGGGNTTTTVGAGAAGSGASGGGTTSAGGGGGSGGEAPVDCTTGDYLLCEDFEADTPGQAPANAAWEMVQNNGATLVVSDERAHKGTQAIHLVTPSGPTVNYLRTTSIFPAAAAGMYGRLHFYVKGPNPEPSGVIHADIVQTSGPDPNFNNTLIHVRYGFIYNKFSNILHYLWNYEKQPRPQGFNEVGVDDNGDNPNIATDTWHCLAWSHDSAASESHLLWNGVERDAMHVTADVNGTPVPFPSFDRISIGWTLYQSFVNGPYEVWIDDIVLDDEPIACDIP